MPTTLLTNIVIILILAIVVLYLSNRFRIPVIVGLLLTGVLVGPHGLRLIYSVQQVELLAEIGVVLLLFTIGLEFSLRNLLKIRNTILMGGTLQMLFTTLVVFGISRLSGLPRGESVFIGFLISLSSTAIVLKFLQERSEVDTPHGRTMLAILIFQDIMVVPLILITPLLGGTALKFNHSFFLLLAQGLGLVGLVIVAAEWVVPWLFFQIARTRSRELFLLSVITLCLAVAWLTAQIGLSLALGAFLAGLIISESEFNHEALSNIIPFRDVFTSIFFISIGMLLDLGVLFQDPILIVPATIGVICLKSILVGLTVIFLGFPLRTAVLVGLSLSQVGEFSFVLSKIGVDSGLLPGNTYQLFLSVSVLSMAATPFLLNFASKGSTLALRLPFPSRIKLGWKFSQADLLSPRHPALGSHLIIAGFGVNGRNVSRAAKTAGIPYMIIEMNPETVRNKQAEGEPIFFGDAAHEAVLDYAGVKTAKVMVIAISDAIATRRITALAHKLNPRLYIIVRTRFVREMKPLLELGANEVIPEEFETSVEIFSRVLSKYLIPRNEIEKLITEVRSDGYEMFRSLAVKTTETVNLGFHLDNLEISAIRVSNQSSVIGKSLAETGFRENYRVTVLAIRRGSNLQANPESGTVIQAHDLVIVMGLPEDIFRMASVFHHIGN
ncbi:MAG: cation:proton antiporter [Proteobacteria bacterium]|nr:cation:proton antiporter [Pseudomonadota bacterium]